MDYPQISLAFLRESPEVSSTAGSTAFSEARYRLRQATESAEGRVGRSCVAQIETGRTQALLIQAEAGNARSRPGILGRCGKEDQVAFTCLDT